MSIEEFLKGIRNILLGQQNKVYTYHKNLIYKTFNTERVMQWRLILEKYSPKLIYILGSKYIAAYVLSRLDIVDTPNTVKYNIEIKNEHYRLEQWRHFIPY